MRYLTDVINYISKLLNEYNEITLLIPFAIMIITIILSFYLSYMVHAFFHEIGHLIAGKLIGCKFLSLRIGTLTIINKNGKLVFKKQKTYGSGGQCLLSAPKVINKNTPYFLSVMGGVLMNLILTILSIIFTFSSMIPISIILNIFSFVGSVFILTNALPLKSIAINNDGRCLLLMYKNKEAQRCYYIQSKICQLLFDGVKYRDISIELFQLSDDADICNDLIGYILLMKYYHYIDSGNYKDAKGCLRRFKPLMYRLSKMMQDELACEFLYLELITANRTDEINNLYMKVQNRLENNICDMHILRIRIALEMLYKKSLDKVNDIYDIAKKLNQVHPIYGEAMFNMYMIDKVVTEYT